MPSIFMTPEPQLQVHSSVVSGQENLAIRDFDLKEIRSFAIAFNSNGSPGLNDAPSSAGEQ